MRVTLAHGGGGAESAELVRRHIAAHLSNPVLDRMDDAAVLDLTGRACFTTDSFVAKPLFFNGGDIGKLAVCGTANDLAVMGAAPRYLALALVIEEGFLLADLDRVLRSVASETAALDMRVVCGDTKVVEKGACDSLFITTSGIGERFPGVDWSASSLEPGDDVLVTGPIGDHGVAMLAARKELRFAAEVASDCAALYPLIRSLVDNGCSLRALRDPTRGGLSAAVNELAAASGVCIRLEQSDIPVREPVRGACDLLGFNPLELANEGRAVIVCPSSGTDRVLRTLRAHPLGAGAAHIGAVLPRGRFPAVLKTPLGAERILEMPRGELLPRIC